MRALTEMEAGTLFSEIDGATSAGSLAGRLRLAFPGKKPSEIAERLGVVVEFGDWFPVTAGEYEHAVRKITVNRRAAVDAEAVIAHELGHHFLDRLAREQDEHFCNDFAAALTAEALI